MQNYYDLNAKEFFESTVQVDMSPVYERFLKHIPVGGSILDAGCGSGRDLKAFIDLGYRGEGFDASSELAELASEYTKTSVRCISFEQVDYKSQFDGIWACASLLHLNYEELPNALQLLAESLNLSGTLYASFKYGNGERNEGGRHFTDLNEVRLKDLLIEVSQLDLLESWVTGDQRTDRSQQWLNFTCKKTR